MTVCDGILVRILGKLFWDVNVGKPKTNPEKFRSKLRELGVGQ
jgi:hypothetical protein